MAHQIHQNSIPPQRSRATQSKPTHNQQTCRCKNRKFHGGRFIGHRCPAPTLGSADGLCAWCRKGHPDHSHHDEARAKH